MRAWMTRLAVGLVGLVVVGCAAQEGADGLALLPDPHPQIADIPVPVGFALQEDNSRSRARGSWRTVDYLYAGSADKFAVIRFYEEHMPTNRWSPVDQRFVQGRETMNFIKDNEAAVVTVYDGGWRRTYVHVDIGPAVPTTPSKK